MIITKPKRLSEIISFLGKHKSIFLVGCGACAAACKTGGEEECIKLKKELEKAGKIVTGYLIVDETCHIPLNKRKFREHSKKIKGASAIIVLACGAGVQAVGSFVDKPLYPALDTVFLGTTHHIGSFSEFCSLCGQCLLATTAAICPVTRCPKGMLNGPCGGVKEGRCEVSPELECVWVLIYERLKGMGELDKIKEIKPPKDYSTRRHPGRLDIDKHRN